MNPRVSVVVIAHDRTRYLRGAVESVLRNATDQFDMEVIVVKRPVDPELDSALRALDVAVVNTDRETLGAKLVLGTRASSGDVLLPLEDDDEFVQDRVATIVKSWSRYPNLGFYHNDFTLIGELGERHVSRIYRSRTARWGRVAGELVVTPHSIPTDRRAMLLPFPGNLSSMAIKRSLILPWFEFLSGLTYSVDVFLFLSVLTTSSWVALDPAQLTRYRIHEASTSATGSLLGHTPSSVQRTYSYLRGSTLELRKILALLGPELDQMYRTELEVRIAMFGSRTGMLDRSISRAELLSSVAKVLRGYRSPAYRQTAQYLGIPELALGLIYVIVPGLSSRMCAILPTRFRRG